MSSLQLGDEGTGKLAENLTGFGRALRRAGLPVDAARISLGQASLACVGLERREDVQAALEAVMLSREQDRAVFREMFDVWFRDREATDPLLAQMLPSTHAESTKPKRPRVREALAPPTRLGGAANPVEKVDLDAAMTASARERLRHADFNGLSASEYAIVERLAREVALPVPRIAARRVQPGARGQRIHWARTLRHASRTGGDLAVLRRLQRREQPVPLLVLVDVSGSMARYARLLLAFLHAATRHLRERHVFAFGTHLSDLTPAFRLGDTDAMLAASAAAIDDYAGGTQLGASLRTLRQRHSRKLVGRRTLVLVISDGLDTGEPGELERELGWLLRSCRKLLWLNPLLRFDGYAPVARGAAVLHRHAHAMLAVHNLASLQDLARSLAAVMKTSN